MCQNEVTLANSLGKPIIPLLFESMQWPPEGQLGLIFTSLLYIKMSGTLESAGNFPENKLQELVQKVRERVGHWNQRAFIHFWMLNVLRALISFR